MPIRKRPNGVYHVELQFLGKRIHRSTRTTNRQEALAFEVDLRRRLLEEAQGQPRTMTLGEACDRYLVEHLVPNARRRKTLGSQESVLRCLQGLLGGPEVPLESLDSARVSDLKGGLLRKGGAKATVNKYLAFLRAVVRKAENEWGVKTARPAFKLLRV